MRKQNHWFFRHAYALLPYLNNNATVLWGLFFILFISPVQTQDRGGQNTGGGGNNNYYYNNNQNGSGKCDQAACRIAILSLIAVSILSFLYCACCCGKNKKTRRQTETAENNDNQNYLKSNPSALNGVWTGEYVEPNNSVGRFQAKLEFQLDGAQDSIKFHSIDDREDNYGKYQIINGKLNMHHGEFSAQKYYYEPRDGKPPYTIVQKGHTDFVITDNQIEINVQGKWYASCDPSYQGDFSYEKNIEKPVLEVVAMETMVPAPGASNA